MLGIVALLLAAWLVNLALVQYLGEPVSRLYRAFQRFVELAPQDWIWAALIALVVLIALRNLPTRRERMRPADQQAPFQAESLESWLTLLQDQSRGEYFRWRLASRLADLESRVSSSQYAHATPQIRDYLQRGRDRRTIRPRKALTIHSPNIEAVISYLERSLEVQHEG
ncbi:MAG: hypothetical protein ACE5JF_00965 [Anaerolineales bacterium]